MIAVVIAAQLEIQNAGGSDMVCKYTFLDTHSVTQFLIHSHSHSITQFLSHSLN